MCFEMLIYQNLATVALIFSIFCHRYEYFDNLKNLLNEDFKFIYKRFILFWGAKQSYVILAECAALWAEHPARKGGSARSPPIDLPCWPLEQYSTLSRDILGPSVVLEAQGWHFPGCQGKGCNFNIIHQWNQFQNPEYIMLSPGWHSVHIITGLQKFYRAKD